MQLSIYSSSYIKLIFFFKFIIYKVEKEIKDKLLVALKDNFKDDTITNANTISNAWNYMFMTVSTSILT